MPGSYLLAYLCRLKYSGAVLPTILYIPVVYPSRVTLWQGQQPTTISTPYFTAQ